MNLTKDRIMTSLQPEEEYPILPQASKNVLGLICMLTLIIGTTTNVAVCYIIGIKNRFAKRFDVFLVSLATTDLLASAFLPIVTIHDLVTDEQCWYILGDGGCKIFETMVPFTAMVSSMMLVLIATGRLRAIRSNIPLPQVRCQTFTETLLVWLFAFLITVPRLAFMKVHNKRCVDPNWHENYIYYITTESLVRNITRLVFIGWYGAVSVSKMSSLHTTVDGLQVCILPLFSMVILYASSCIVITRRMPAANRIMSSRRLQYKKMSRMFTVLVIVFITCTAPHSIFIFVVYSNRYKQHGAEYTFKNFSTVELYLENGFRILLALNHCINPYIYAKMHQSLGKYLKMIKRRWYLLRRIPDEDENRGTRGSYTQTVDHALGNIVSSLTTEPQFSLTNIGNQSPVTPQVNTYGRFKVTKTPSNMSTNSYMMY